METGVVVIQESVSATIIEGANDYLLSVHADGTVKNDDIEEPPGIGDHPIKAPEVKIVPDESNNGVTIDEDKFSGSAEAREVPNESGNTENDGSERVEKTEHEKETDLIVETPEITKEKAREAEKETGSSDFPLGKQVSNVVEATSVHESDVVSIAESLNREEDGDDDKAQPVETISMKNDEEIILDAATTDSNKEEEMSRKIEEIHESSKVIDDAASTENKTVQEELPITGNSPIHEEMAESSDASTSTPPENMKRELVRSCKEGEMVENSNQAHEESRRSTYKDIEEHVTEETVSKDTTIVTESEDADCTTAPEKEGLKNAMAQEEIPKNDVPVINEIEGIETTTAEEEHITKNAETILNATEVVHITKDTELLDAGEATKDCHLEPEENLSKKEMLQKEGDDTSENEIKAAQTTALAEQEIPRNVMPIVNETEAVDITTAEEEISKNAGMILDETEAVHSGIAAEEKIAKDTVLLDEGEAIKEGHPEQQENLTTKEMLQKQGEETTGNETEAVQTTTLAGNDILTNVVPVVNETEAVHTTTAKEKEISTNAETVLHATEAVHYGISAEEKIPKDTELLDEGKATKEGHLEPEENLTKKEMLQKEGEETKEKESEAVQTTALAEEEIPRNAVPIVNETEAVDTTTTEEEKISKNAETFLDATEAVHSVLAAEEKIAKDTELLDEGETTKEGYLEPEENLIKKEVLQKEGGATTENESETVQTTTSAEEEIPKNAVPVVNETEAVDSTAAEEENTSKNAETVLDATEVVHSAITAEEKSDKVTELLDEGETTKGHLGPEESLIKKEMLQKEGEETIKNGSENVQPIAPAEEEIPRNAVPVNETESVDTTTAEDQKASKNAEQVLDATEAVDSAIVAEETMAKDTELFNEGEATKEGHLKPEENQTKREMLQREGEETTENENESVQTTASPEEEIPRNGVPVVNETAVDSTTAEEENASKNAEIVLDATEVVHCAAGAEENIAKASGLLGEREATKDGHLEEEENPNKKQMLQKEGEEPTENEDETAQTTASAEEKIQRNFVPLVNETIAVDSTTAEKEETSKNADTVLDVTEAVHTTTATKGNIAKDAVILDEGGITEEGHLEHVTKENCKEMLQKDGEETIANETGLVQTTAAEEEEFPTTADNAVNETKAIDTSTEEEEEEEEEEISKSADTDVDAIDAAPSTIAAEERTSKDAEILEKSPQGSSVESEVTTESEVVTEKSEGENEVGEKLLEKSTTHPDGKITQEEEPEIIQVAKEEGLELEESPSGNPLKVQTEDHDSENKKKLIEESQKIDEVEETDIAPELFIPSKDQNTEEDDRTGESEIMAEQRGLTPDDLEMEKTGQNKARSGASDETTHDHILPEVEPIEKMEKTSLEFSSEGLEKTTETVDEAIEEKPEEAEIPEQEGEEESSSAVKTKAETHSPLGSKELGERAQEERSVDDPIPPQEESHLPKEQVDETESQKEKTEKHESPKEEIIEDQETIIVEKKSDELLIIPSTLPSEEQEHETLAESEKIEDKKVKEAETGADRVQEVRETTETPELKSVSSLTAEMLEPDETTSSELVSGLDEQVPKQVEEILEEEIKEADGIKAEKVLSSEDIAQEISEKQALASALVSKEENQVNTSDGATINEAKGEDEVLERNESQTEVPDAAETEETVFPEEKQHGDPRPLKSDECTNDKTQLQEKLLNFPYEENPKEDEERHQLLEPLSKDTVAVDRGLPLEELRMPNEETKASNEQIQIPPNVGDNEMREGSDLTKVKEATDDQSLLEEQQHEESALGIKQEETPTEETKETEKTMALEGSSNSETLELIQAKDFEAPKIDDAEEAKSQKVTETIEEQEAQADHCFPVEIPHGETIPRESSNGKTPSSGLASGEEEQATAYDAETIQERKSEDEVKKGNEGEEKGPAAVEIEDNIGNKETTESGHETKEKLECSGVEEGTGTPAAQSHIDDKSDDQIETQSYTLTLEKEIEKPSTEATKIDDEDTKKTNTEGTETLEVHGISKTSENGCLNQEDFKELGTPKQGGMTEDQTPLKGESPDDASYSIKTGEVERGVDPSSTLSDSQTEIEIQTTLDTERDIRDAPSLVETITIEPAEQIQNVGEPDVESNEKNIESSGKPEDIETESPVSENTGSKAEEKQDIKEAEDTSIAEAKQESSLQRNESRETETLQARNDVEEQSLPANEIDFQKKHTEVVERQEEYTREDQASVETKILKEQTREIVERQEEIPAGEKIQILSSVLSSEEPEHALSTDKPEDRTGEFEIPKNDIQEGSGPSDLIEIISDQNTPEERKEEEEEDNGTIEKAHNDADAAAVEKACLQEEHSRDPNASIERAEGEKVDIIEGNKNEEIQDEKPENPFATRQKEEAFLPGVKADHGDANEREVTHDLKSPEVEKKEPQSALGNEEDINNVVSSEKQIIQPTEVGEKPDDAVSESTEETVDSGINWKQGGEETEETSVAETENEEQSQQEQSKEADISTADKSTSYLDLPTEQAPIDQIEEVKMHEEQPRELEAQIGEILAEQPLKKDAHVEQEEISAREKRKETSLSEEKGPQDVVKHEVDCSLNSQRTEVVEEPRQLSSSLAPEDNKRENIDTEPEVEEKAKDDSENVEKQGISEASDVSLTEPTVMSKEATPKDNVMKIQALEMIESDEIRQNEVAGKENNDTSEKSDQVSLQEVKTQVYKDNEQTNVSTAVTGDIPKEEKLSGGKEEITAENSFEETMLLPESLPAKADNVLAEKETAQENLDDRKDTDEETKNIKPEAQKFESVSSGSLLQDACSKIEEQETEILQMEGCPIQPKEIAEEVQKVEKTIPFIIDKDTPVEDTLPQKKIAEDSQENKGEADESENIKGSPSEVKEIEHVEKETNNLDEQVTKSPTSRESERNSLSDLLQKVKEVKKPTTGEEGMQVEEAKADKDDDTKVSHAEEAKTDEQKDEHKEDKTSPDSVVMMEARDVNDKTPHKKSHNILSGVGSKVKNSISKVKKAITGKSSHTKPVSPN